MNRRIPKTIQHDWKFYRVYDFGDGRPPQKNIHVCAACDGWTANLPAYKHEVCEGKDRRKKSDRRKA